MARVVAQASLETAQRELREVERAVAEHTAVISTRGWVGQASCHSIAVVPTPAEPRPYDVVPEEDHDEVARRVCVHRTWRSRRMAEEFVRERRKALSELRRKVPPNADPADVIALARQALLREGPLDSAFMAPAAADLALDPKHAVAGSGLLDQRRMDQAAALQRDWRRFSPSTHEYEPHLGTRGEGLPLAAAAADAAFEVVGPDLARELGAEWLTESLPPPDQRTVAGFIGGVLDAYTGCVDDGRKQLAITLESWEALERRRVSGDRERALREFKVRECQQAVGAYEQSVARRATLQGEIAEQQRIVADMAARPWPKREVLNAAACTGNR